ncbi:orotidine 5'-phosphate decarboxylase / HUMPS family domain-containing protein [Ditylenchus destructor]|nr:orotidine 5'-phosphate decarboxylase / HUMPS family domain-containing protein [Ditylenchus destructor]
MRGLYHLRAVLMNVGTHIVTEQCSVSCAADAFNDDDTLKNERGLDFAKSLIAAKKKVFLDMKLLDIDNTIAKGVENVAKMGVSMLTLHAYPKAMRSAVEAAKGSALPAWRDGAGRGHGRDCCVAAEAFAIRQAIGPDRPSLPQVFVRREPRRRPEAVMTPADALEAGASHLVVARPIVGASDRRASALAILEEMRSVA